MRPKRLLLWLLSPLMILIGLIALMRNTREIDWATGQPISGLRDTPETEPQPAGVGSWRWIAGQLSPRHIWRAFVDARSFLAERYASSEQEWMDLPGRDPRELAGTFRDLRRVNRWLGGDWLTIRGLERLNGDLQLAQGITILDVASGPADIPRVISDWTQRRGLKSMIVATDINPDILGMAKALNSPGSLELVTADARGLPFADRSFDVATCSLVLHHLDPEDVVNTLREMRRVARDGVLVNDMVRGWTGYLGAWTLSRLMTRNRISRHDAPLSARRAYTRAELVDLVTRAGLEPIAAHSFFGYRVVMVTRAVETKA